METIEVKDLEVGDEILISCQSYFKYLRVLRKPALSTKTHWNTGAPLYKSVKCSTRREEKQVTYHYRGNPFTRTEKMWVFGPEDHNYTHYVNLEHRQIILVKKNEQ
jgi:alpha-ketoglutarate-dependent taurine dioxygenase